MALALGDGGGWVYGVQEAMPQPVVGSPTATGTRGGGGGSPKRRQQHRAMGMALEASNLSTIYVFMSAGEQ